MEGRPLSNVLTFFLPLLLTNKMFATVKVRERGREREIREAIVVVVLPGVTVMKVISTLGY